jgi:hypothetical protein
MSNSGLIVRRTERFEISIPARVRVAMQHVDAVQFAKGVTDSDRWMNIDVVDFSGGGVGFVTDLFFARSLDVEIEIPALGDSGGESLLKCYLRVKRVQMTDRRPAYLIGCAFTNVDEEIQSAIDALLELLRGQSDDAHSDGGNYA